MLTLEITGLTDIGQHRDNNEDCIGLEPAKGLVVLADGMGGHKAGEVASRMCVDTVLTCPSPTALRTSVENANQAVHEKGQSSLKFRGMGTTVVAVMRDADTLHWAHVGDSRLYMLRNDSLQQLTRDHSLVQEFIDQGLCSPEEARQKVARNMLTRALGTEAQVKVDTGLWALEAGDTGLLCSDGLYEMLPDSQIMDCLKSPLPLPERAKSLIALANQAGGKDNISVILFEAH